ncbi:hypothetical protein KJS94_13945 [Flavihumibacter rivuli]|uniref:hypothetical protein n=1 Tax=Flavihumibacter rivuli TaxID=2838156 RepID=UPI001BDDD0AD|nr:hypothetical protein [Flavihumibacter rivuli]ULQ55746.1 hypothetical protein KJS94_13945 [Flavihumibacter rivuli]
MEANTPDPSIIKGINDSLSLALPEQISFEELRTQLAAKLNELISKDFNQLISILYRVDVSEPKLKYLLREKVGEDAAMIMADLIIERQIQKANTRKAFRDLAMDDDEEKW